MFGRKPHKAQKAQTTASSQAAEAGLELQTVGNEVIYNFPPGVKDALRHMVTRLQLQQALPPKLALVGALRHEGVSMMSLALAATIAHDLARIVCLVDLNWHWPSAFMCEQAATSSGLLPLLRGETSWDQALVRTNLPNLAILPAGPLLPTQRPVVARSVALKTLLQEVSSRVDHLILDIPAILTTSDALPLASLADACCMVIHQGVSSRATVHRAVQEMSHVTMLGVVMNRVQMTTPPWLLKYIPQG